MTGFVMFFLLLTNSAMATPLISVGSWPAQDGASCEIEAAAISQAFRSAAGVETYYRCDRQERGEMSASGECDLANKRQFATITLVTADLNTPWVIDVDHKNATKAQNKVTCAYDTREETVVLEDGTVVAVPRLFTTQYADSVPGGGFATKADCEAELVRQKSLPVLPTYFKAFCREGYDATFYFQTFTLVPR